MLVQMSLVKILILTQHLYYYGMNLPLLTSTDLQKQKTVHLADFWLNKSCPIKRAIISLFSPLLDYPGPSNRLLIHLKMTL